MYFVQYRIVIECLPDFPDMNQKADAMDGYERYVEHLEIHESDKMYIYKVMCIMCKWMISKK